MVINFGLRHTYSFFQNYFFALFEILSGNFSIAVEGSPKYSQDSVYRWAIYIVFERLQKSWQQASRKKKIQKGVIYYLLMLRKKDFMNTFANFSASWDSLTTSLNMIQHPGIVVSWIIKIIWCPDIIKKKKGEIWL